MIRKRKGFTIVESMIGVLIIGLSMVGFVNTYSTALIGFRQGAKLTESFLSEWKQTSRMRMGDYAGAERRELKNKMVIYEFRGEHLEYCRVDKP